MRFLADECFDARLATRLAAAGHDVLTVQQFAPSASDEEVLARAFRDRRVVLTEDTDFGELVYRLQQPTVGILLLRLHDAPLHVKEAALWPALAQPDRLIGRFTVVQADRIRVRELPQTP